MERSIDTGGSIIAAGYGDCPDLMLEQTDEPNMERVDAARDRIARRS
jgi:hypothetical protein